MNEGRMLRRIRGGDSEALGAAIEQYAAYVAAIARNIVEPPLQPEDVEEISADVFLRLWRNASDVQEGRLKAWLAAVTRNCARDRLRRARLPEPLAEDCLEISFPGPEDGLVRAELRQLARAAVESLPEPDRGIFMRYYYLCQKTDEIAAALGMNPATVRTRLARGRDKLRAFLIERGYRCEAVDF